MNDYQKKVVKNQFETHLSYPPIVKREEYLFLIGENLVK